MDDDEDQDQGFDKLFGIFLIMFRIIAVSILLVVFFILAGLGYSWASIAVALLAFLIIAKLATDLELYPS